MCDKWLLRLVGDDPTGLALFRLEEFEIVTSKVPATWRIGWNKNGFLTLSPEAWGRLGFWEQYYDREPQALQVFEEERRKIVESDP